MHSFFVIKDTPQTEKVSLAELTHVFHEIRPKHHNSYVAQDCTVKIMKTSAIVTKVLYPYTLGLVLIEKKTRGAERML